MICAYRESGWWKRIEMQPVKWTTEGIGKGISRVFYDVRTYVSCQEYVSILKSA